jgi:mannonate dehydratase
VETSEPGLYGIGSASDFFRPGTVPPAVEVLAQGLLGRDPDEIEDIWQSSYMSSLWRNNATLNLALSGVDMALWDLKGKRANMPVYQLLGGRCRAAVPVYDHAREDTTFDGVVEGVRASVERGFTHIRIQLGGYGGGGFIELGGHAPGGRTSGRVFDEDLYIETIPRLFEYTAGVGFGRNRCTMPRKFHATESDSARKAAGTVTPLFLKTRSIWSTQWYRSLRQVTVTLAGGAREINQPGGVHAADFRTPVDFIRFRIAKVGGITPARKMPPWPSFRGKDRPVRR